MAPVYLHLYQKLGRLSLIQPCDVFSETFSANLETETPVPVDLSGATLTAEQLAQISDCLARYRHVFSCDENDSGWTATISHQIPSGDAPPIRERHRQIHPNLYQEVRTLLQGMLEAGIVHKSCSPWASPIVLVRNKDGSLRFCVNYHKVNAVTFKDAFPLP